MVSSKGVCIDGGGGVEGGVGGLDEVTQDKGQVNTPDRVFHSRYSAQEGNLYETSYW